MQLATFLCLYIIQDLFGTDKLFDVTVRSSHFSCHLANTAMWQIHFILNVSNLNCRRVARAEDEAELASVGQQLGGSGNDWDEEVLNAEEEGLVFFDGNAQMHCSAITIML